MAQYVYCKGHKPGCQGYRLAEILSKMFTLPGKPGKEQEDSSTCCFRVRFPDASFTRPHEAAQKPHKHDKIQGD
jgi:hypothetical protein